MWAAVGPATARMCSVSLRVLTGLISLLLWESHGHELPSELPKLVSASQLINVAPVLFLIYSKVLRIKVPASILGFIIIADIY